MAISCVLLDIEGTTTSISFVKDELFPYVRKNLQSYLESKWDSREVQDDINSLRTQVKVDVENGIDGVPQIASISSAKSDVINSVVANVLWQMDQDRKITPLKQLQGHMWRDGYQTGVISGHVYDDVEESLKIWTATGKKVYIYSSGSVEAQKLLFKHSIAGDLLQYLSGHFDTKIGLKINSSSYEAIVKEVGEEPNKILFLTDIPAEAVAASQVGIQAKLMVRPGNSPLGDEILQRFSTFNTFRDVNKAVMNL